MIDTVLQYSGGKDSRVLLHMFREKLDNMYVVWLNTGAVYPEVEAEMVQLQSAIPTFMILRSDQPGQIARNGFPSDVLPINYSPWGRIHVKSAEQYKVQDAFNCCAQNIWGPMDSAMKAMGIKTIIRGQRRSEKYTNTSVTNGSVVDGVKYLLPIEDWSDTDVFSYLKEHGVALPSYYRNEYSSHDCWNCTAHLAANKNRIANLPGERREEVLRRLVHIRAAIEAESAPLTDILAVSRNNGQVG